MTDYNTHIEINIVKLLDWLISRRHCPQNWSTKLEPIRQKISLAIQDMPEDQKVKDLLNGNYLHYFHCLEIVNILKETEASSKNIFGYYSSQRMKDWNEILKLYRADGIYIGESAYLLNRYVNYELPALKKQLEKCSKNREELSKKKREYESSAQEYRMKFKRICDSYGIKGENVSLELLNLAADLPTWMNELTSKIGQLSPIIDLYEEFVHFVTKSNEFQACTLLRRFITLGNITAYEWLHGTAPDSIEMPHSALNSKENDEANIAWDDGNDIIDFGIENESTENVTAVPVSKEGDNEGIDFDIEIECDMEDATGEKKDTMNLSSVLKVARGDEALSVLENTRCRNELISDMYELMSFLFRLLEERRGHVSTGGGEQQHTFALLEHDMWSDAPERLRNLRVEELKEKHSLTHSIIDELTKPNSVRLFLIRSSSHFVNSLVDEITAPLKDSNRFQNMAALAGKRMEDTVTDDQETRESIAVLRKNYSQLRDKIAEEISTIYHNRPIQFTGEGHFL